MSQYDLIVRNGTLVTTTGTSTADLAVADGHIVAIESEHDSGICAKLPHAQRHGINEILRHRFGAFREC